MKPNDIFITKPSLSDGHGGIETRCKEYTLSRSDPRSRIHCKIPGGTKIGPVIEVRVARIFGIYGLEVAVPSIRGKNRFVDEMEDPTSVTMSPASIWSKCKQTRMEQVLPKTLNTVFGSENAHLIL